MAYAPDFAGLLGGSIKGPYQSGSGNYRNEIPPPLLERRRDVGAVVKATLDDYIDALKKLADFVVDGRLPNDGRVKYAAPGS